ncbi:MAG TPA: S8 family serine peptidase, partial [Blastocatellia bacterium]|nr:S8 family serine peptidase [Blastocatellia bacterium]
TAITPGTLLSSGGLPRQKPDITAADGVMVTGAGGFPSQFYGTSAAAPHAGAVAALIKSANPSLTSAQIRSALVSTAIDIEAPGVDRDSGAGIVMAFEALQSIGVVPSPNFELGAVTLTEVSGNDNSRIEAGETATLSIELRNTGVVSATGVTAVLTTAATGVTITNQVVSYPTLTAPTGSAVGATPFTISLSSTVGCVNTIEFSLRISYTGGASQRAIPIPLQAGPPPITITTTLDDQQPPSGPGYTAATGLQDFRVNRDGFVAGCGEQKECAGTVPPTIGPRRFDSYKFTSCPSEGPKCVTVSLTNKCTGSAFALFAVAYLGSFDPNDVCGNYFADAGVSKTNGTTSSFSFDAPAGSTFVIIVHEVGSGVAVGCDYSLSVAGLCLPCPGPAFGLALRPGSQTVVQGGSSSYTLDVQSMLGFAQPVNLTAAVAPSNGAVTAEVSPGAVPPGTPATLTVRAGTSAPIGSSYTVTVTGASGGITRVTRTTVTVTGPDYVLSFSPSSVTANRATRVSSMLNIARLGGHTGTIDITAPDTSSIGVKLKPPAAATTDNSVTFKFKVKEGATVGTHQLVFTGRDPAGRQRIGTVTLIIQ